MNDRTMIKERCDKYNPPLFSIRLAMANRIEKNDAQRRLDLPCITHCAS